MNLKGTLFLTICVFLFLTRSEIFGQNHSREDYLLVIKYSSKMISEDPKNNIDYFRARAEAYYAMDELSKALGDYDKYLAKRPNDYFIFYNRGVVKDGMGKFNDAIDDFSKAIKKSSKVDPDFYFARGSSYHSLKNYNKAISDYTVAISNDPSNKDALNNMGLLLIEKKEYKSAIPFLDKALSIDPDFINSHINRAHALIEIGNYLSAIEDLQYALRISPQNLSANDYMAYCLYKQGKKLEACQYYKIVIAHGASPMTNDFSYCK